MKSTTVENVKRKTDKNEDVVVKSTNGEEVNITMTNVEETKAETEIGKKRPRNHKDTDYIDSIQKSPKSLSRPGLKLKIKRQSFQEFATERR